MKFDSHGKVLQKKLYTTNNTLHTYYNSQKSHSLYIAKNGDFIIGGARFGSPYVMRTDSAGNLKWATWYYDSIADRSYLNGGGIINYLRETSRGIIICAAGDEYPNNNGYTIHNYAALLQFDSLGRSPYIDGEACYVTEFTPEAGYNINGFCIDETLGKNYVIAGNQNVYYSDTIGNPIWRKAYTFWLDGVGTVTNNVYRAKVLRDNTLMVAGQAYEGNCWNAYKHLYYDAWWTPVDYASGSNKTKDTAGLQGGDDIIYDFTQLTNGNLVFIGVRDNKTTDIGGIWMFVTDSTGKKILWEKQQQVTYKNSNINANNAIGFAVCATDDGGFTVVGEKREYDSLGGTNALVAHFIPKTVSAVVSRSNSLSESMNGFSVYVVGAKLVVSCKTPGMAIGEVSLFDVSGKRFPLACGRGVANGRGEVSSTQFDISKLSRGAYFVRVKSGTITRSMKFVY
jgi:hypothetical protein